MVALLAVTGTIVGGWLFYSSKHTVRPDLLTDAVKRQKLQITITERGSLEPADNTFFSCKVKSKTPGGAATSIRWVIDNGSFVKEGERILELDDSALQDSKTTQEIEFYKAKQAWKQAQLTRTINMLTNEADVEVKKTAVKVAEIGLKEYEEGLYVQSRIDLQNKVEMSKSDLFMWEERAKWSDRMSRPGRQYVTVSQAEADEARHKTAELTQANYIKQLEVLDNLTRKKNVVSLSGVIDDAKNNLKMATEKLKKTLELDDANEESTYAQYVKQMSKLNEIEKEIDSSLIRAPRDGMVVYYVEERARWNQTGGIIAQGEQVKEGQKLVAVPDLTQLVVNARIHEAMVPKVRDDVVKVTGFSEAVNTSLLFTPDPFAGLIGYIAFDSDLQTAFANKHSDVERTQERHGLPAMVRVNAFPNRPLKAHVKSVAPVASQADMFGADVKVYQTYIAVDDDRLQGLKPGMDAVVTIYVDSTPEPVLTVPLHALLGSADMGDKRHCFVMAEGHSPEIRDITLGKFNEQYAEVKEGLNEGEVVVLNPAILLSDKEKAQYGVPASGDQGGRGGYGGAKGAKGGKGGKNFGGKDKGSYPGMKGGPEGGPGGGMPGGGRRGGKGGFGAASGAPSGGKVSSP